MRQILFALTQALIGVAFLAWLTSALLPWLGLTSAALLFLLPVLLVAAQGQRLAAIVAALAGAAAYNFFLVPPRFTFRIHAPENVVSVLALIAVAVVTSRLAARLHAREGEALALADRNHERAELAGLLAVSQSSEALSEAMAWIGQRFGTVHRIARGSSIADEAGFSALDQSAAAWAMHNAECTGHATMVMPAADWTFVPVSPRGASGTALLAVARPVDGSTRTADELAALRDHAAMLGQAADRADLDEERRKRERLEREERLRQSLLAALAHDFRSPLTVIRGQLEAAQNEGAGMPEARMAARRIERMMEDLIGAARLDHGGLSLRLEPVDVVDIVTDALGGMAAGHPVTIRQSIAGDLPFVVADPALLAHIVGNLVDNGLRHARSLVIIEAEERDDRILLHVRDDGPGIPEGERERIFERFIRIAGSDRTSGSGLGLAIAKGFADAMNMTLTPGVAVEGGAAFTLSMNLARLATGSGEP